MLMPSIFGENLFDDWMSFPFRNFNTNSLMKTDIRETDGSFELDIDMPGFNKEDLKAELKEGYLTISASTNKDMWVPAAEASTWARILSRTISRRNLRTVS